MELKDLIKKYRDIKIDPASIELNRIKLLAYFKDNFPSQRKDLFFYFKPVFATIVALFVFVASSGGLVVYAQKSAPGDILYSFKRLTEKVVYQLTPQNRKPVLRAEMVEKRLSEVRTLVEKNGPENLENQLSIKEATIELEKEIVALKKEINPEKQQDKVVANRGELPILDNKKIIKVIQQKNIDLDKILTATKEAIRDNNLTIALEKIDEVVKIFTEPKEELTSEPENTKPSNESEEIMPPTEENILSPTPITPKPDFKIDLGKEDSGNSFKTEIIKE